MDTSRKGGYEKKRSRKRRREKRGRIEDALLGGEKGADQKANISVK